MSNKKFPQRICVSYDTAANCFIIVGEPENPSQIDAENGDKIAIYTLTSPVKVFRQHPSLDDLL